SHRHHDARHASPTGAFTASLFFLPLQRDIRWRDVPASATRFVADSGPVSTRGWHASRLPRVENYRELTAEPLASLHASGRKTETTVQIPHRHVQKQSGAQRRWQCSCDAWGSSRRTDARMNLSANST
ncbi:unnamed protein product, partial [Ixodes pacificus]